MKFRFSAALLIAALSITLLSGCAAAPVSAPVSAETQPVLTVTEEPALPLAPLPETEALPATPVSASPVPAEAPTVPAATAEVPLITKEEAIAIALADAGFTAEQVSRLRAEFDRDDRRPEYEVEFRRDRYEYDYEIHAETGAILSKDIDRED